MIVVSHTLILIALFVFVADLWSERRQCIIQQRKVSRYSGIWIIFILDLSLMVNLGRQWLGSQVCPLLSVPEEGQIASKSVSSSLGRAGIDVSAAECNRNGRT